MIFWVAVASIAAVIAAGAAIASAIIYWKTFQSVNAQTEVSRKQLEQAESARREASRPRLSVEISEYQLPELAQLRSDIGFRLRNAGQVGFHVVRIRTQSGDTQNQDVVRLIEVHPSYPEETFVNILPVDRCNPPVLKAWFEIETNDGGRCELEQEWEWLGDKFALRKSNIVDEA